MKREEVKVPKKYRARVTEDAYRDGYMAGYYDKALMEALICASMRGLFDSLSPASMQAGAEDFAHALRLVEAKLGRAGDEPDTGTIAQNHAPSLGERLRRMEKEQKR